MTSPMAYAGPTYGPTFEELVADINADGWTLHSMSQYRNMGKLMWSATVRRDGSGRQPISRGRHLNPIEALHLAYCGISTAELEPEVVATGDREPVIVLANLLPAPPLPPIPVLIVRRR